MRKRRLQKRGKERRAIAICGTHARLRATSAAAASNPAIKNCSPASRRGPHSRNVASVKATKEIRGPMPSAGSQRWSPKPHKKSRRRGAHDKQKKYHILGGCPQRSEASGLPGAPPMDKEAKHRLHARLGAILSGFMTLSFLAVVIRRSHQFALFVRQSPSSFGSFSRVCWLYQLMCLTQTLRAFIRSHKHPE